MSLCGDTGRRGDDIPPEVRPLARDKSQERTNSGTYRLGFVAQGAMDNLTRNLRELFRSGDDLDEFGERLRGSSVWTHSPPAPILSPPTSWPFCAQIDTQITIHQSRDMQRIRMMMAAKLSEADGDTQMLFAEINHNAERVVAGSTRPAFIKNARMNVIDELVMVMNHGGKTQAREKEHDEELEKEK